MNSARFESAYMVLRRLLAMAALGSCVLLPARQALAQDGATVKGENAAPETTAAKSTKASNEGPEPIKLGSLTISGSLRVRVENWDWFDTTAANGNYTFGAAVLRLGIGQQKEKFDWQVEGEFPWLINLPEHAIAPAPQGQLGLGATYFAANLNQDGSAILKQAYLRVKDLGGDRHSSFRLGRFEFIDGGETAPADPTLATLKRDHIAHRLIGPFTFSHVGRSFDGAQYVRNTKTTNITFLAARPTEGVFQLRGMRELDVDLYYGAFTKSFNKKEQASDARLFVLYYHDGRRVLKTDNRPAALRAADGDNIRITTFGGHYIGAYKTAAGTFDALFWGAGQFGEWGRLDHHAGAIAAEGGFQPRFASLVKPWIRAGFFRSTGDGNPTDGNHTTFFQVLPTPRVYARFPFYNLMNNEDIFAELRLKPHARLSLRSEIHYLQLSNTHDLWYQGGGAFQQNTFGYTGRPSNGRKTLGTMTDLSVDYNLTSRSVLTFYIAGVTGSSVAQGVYPLGNSARFGYFEFTQRF